MRKKQFFTTIFIFTVLSVWAVNPAVEAGIEKYREGLFAQSLLDFRNVILDTDQSEDHGSAYFWISKNYLALDKISEASENIEYYLLNYPENQYYPEGLYTKGRILFLQKEYENSIRVFYNFLAKYPKTPFTANSYFWIAEALFSLGHLEDAYKLYSHLIDKYPESYKIEAAKYRISLIDLKDRETELLKLIKISHEEYLESLDYFQRRERTYDQAISAYQKRIAELSSGEKDKEIEDLKTDIVELENELTLLKKEKEKVDSNLTLAEVEKNALNERISALEEKIEELKETGPSAPEVVISTTGDGENKTIELLSLKVEALKLQSFYYQTLYNLERESE